jgi:predicted secreted protein
MHPKTAQLLSDALTLDTQPQAVQERIMSGLLAEIEAANSKLSALTAGGGTPSPADTGDMLKMLSTFSQARQGCPQCQAAQAQLPPMNFGGCPAPPMLPPQMQPVMRSIVPYGVQGMYDVVSNDTLKMGAKGAEVRRLQSLLTAAGYKVAVDGIFGEKTEKALVKFQYANDLRGDGIMNDVDWTKLQAVAGAKTGATSRAEAGKNDVPTTTEKLAPITKTLVRVVAPLTIGAATGVGLWLTVKQSNITQKAAICAGSGLAAAAVSYVAINFAADALTTIPEETL